MSPVDSMITGFKIVCGILVGITWLGLFITARNKG